MKTKLNFLAVVAFAFCTGFQAHSQGYLVPNGVTYAGGGTSFGGTIHVIQSPTTLDYTGFTFPPMGPNTFQFNPFLDEGVRVFFVSQGDPIDVSSIQANAYQELTYPNTYQIQNGAQFLVGLYTGYAPVNGIYANPMFGWAELFNNNGVIQLGNSALAYDAQGIYAGTQNLVPEPTTLSLFGLGLLGLGWHLRRRVPH